MPTAIDKIIYTLKKLSNLENVFDAHEMQSNLEKINDVLAINSGFRKSVANKIRKEANFENLQSADDMQSALESISEILEEEFPDEDEDDE